MNILSKIRSRTWVTGVACVVAALGLLVAVGADRETSVSASERHLFVWAGDQARQAPDFLAVVNFDEKDPNYGKVITRVPLPGPGASGNEPHHVGLSRDGRVLACGGLLSVLKGQSEIFFFDVKNPAEPKFLSSADPPRTASTRMGFRSGRI